MAIQLRLAGNDLVRELEVRQLPGNGQPGLVVIGGLGFLQGLALQGAFAGQQVEAVKGAADGLQGGAPGIHQGFGGAVEKIAGTGKVIEVVFAVAPLAHCRPAKIVVAAIQAIVIANQLHRLAISRVLAGLADHRHPWERSTGRQVQTIALAVGHFLGAASGLGAFVQQQQT